MWRNYLAVAVRNLARNKLYSAINIIGLAVGFAAAILVALFVRDELSYNCWIPGYERTYLVSETIELGNAQPIVTPASPAELAGWLRQDFQDIEVAARLHPERLSVRRGDAEYTETFFWADPDIFKALPFPAVAGNLDTALARPDGVVLSRKMANKYFGRSDPIGQTLEIDRRHVATVTAVIEDFPTNTTIDIQMLVSGRASFSELARIDVLPPPLASGTNEAHVFTYLRLKPGASIEALRKAMPAFIQRHAQLGPNFQVSFSILPIAHIQLTSLVFYGVQPARLTALYASVVIGLLIVLIAGINFVNLMTARAMRRATEVGIRKACGARRRDLVCQFIGECLVYSSLAVVAAIALVEILLPSFNAFLDRRIVFDYWHDHSLMGLLLALTAFIGILAGIYPAFVLASLKPASMLGAHGSCVGSKRVRQGLVIFQFSALIGLILATAVVQRQNHFALNQSLGADTDQVLIVETSCKESFKQAVQALPGVRTATCSASLPSISAHSQSYAVGANGKQAVLWYSSVDFGFFELYGLRPLAGRFFSRTRGGDALPVAPGPIEREALVVNETAARKLGFNSATAAANQTIRCGHAMLTREFSNMHRCEIVGVVPDSLEGSVREPVPPAAYYVYPPQFLRLNIKLDGRQIPQTLTAIEREWKKFGDPWPIKHVFLDRHLEEVYRDITRQAEVFAVFAAVALIIACLGLFALSAFTAEQRTCEIGVRKAMGADTRDIVRLLLWQFSKPVLWAALIAWPVAGFLMRRWLDGFAYHVDLQPRLFVLSALLAWAIALITVSTHSILIARVKPVTALRHE